MCHKQLTILAIALGLVAISPTAMANHLTGASATANCQGYSLTVNANELTTGITYTIKYTFTLTCGGSTRVVPGSITFTATAATATETATGTFGGMSGNCNVTGSATLTSSGSTVTINVNGQGTSPALLTCPSLTLACAAGSGQVGLSYDSNLVASGGVPPYTFSITAGSLPSGLTLNPTSGAITGTATASGAFSFTAQAVDSSGNAATDTVSDHCGITIAPGPPPPTCSTGLQPITYNLHESSQNASEIVWFNSHFKLQGTLPTSDFTVQVVNGTIQFGSSTLTVPNATITFSSSATCASTKFDTAAKQWETTIPLSAAGKVDEIFAAGLAFVLPASFPQNVQGVTWTADFTASVPSLQMQWQWGAANYLSNKNGDVFPMTGGAPDYNAMMVNPGHNVTTCAGYNSGDHAGTPENATVKALVTGGGSGGGGSNWTGSWSSTQSLVCKQ